MPRSFRALVGLAAASVFAFLAMSCVGAFYVRARGNVKTGVVFEFYASKDATRASATPLREFEVQQKVGTDSWSTIWKIRGDGKLEAVQYGVVPAGFTSTTAPLPMLPEASYRAFGEGESWPQGRSIASLSFVTDSAGIPRTDYSGRRHLHDGRRRSDHGRPQRGAVRALILHRHLPDPTLVTRAPMTPVAMTAPWGQLRGQYSWPAPEA